MAKSIISHNDLQLSLTNLGPFAFPYLKTQNTNNKNGYMK